MSIIKLDKRLTDQLTLRTNAPRVFLSSSMGGVTGSVSLFSERSKAIKEKNSNRPGAAWDDNSFSGEFFDINRRFLNPGGSTNLYRSVDQFMNRTQAVAKSESAFKAFAPRRFESPFVYDVNYAAISCIKKTLFPLYRNTFRDFDFSFRNYNTLNFFTSSDVPSDSCLIYAKDQNNSPFITPGQFTFDFYINPRYTTDDPGQPYSAGTILHLSSTYAVSLITGSSRDNFGLPDGYRVLLQLSQSADVNPVDINTSTSNNDRVGQQQFCFLSEDNSLKKNNWHHVSIRWGTETSNQGTGSFVIDNVNKGNFVIPSASIQSSALTVSVLFVGAKYNGSNTPLNGSLQTRFFSTARTILNGTPNISGAPSINLSSVSITNPLNAEIHDLKIFSEMRSKDQIYSSSLGGISDLSLEPNLLFYLPPFFVKESPKRRVLYTPYNTRANRTTDAPFEVTQSFSLRTQYNSLENYTREFVTGLYPIPFALTGSAQGAGSLVSPTDVIYRLPEVRKRNLTILPNDNGLFKPQFSLLISGTQDYSSSSNPQSRFVSDFGNLDLSRVSLRNIINLDEQKSKYNRNINTGVLISDKQPASTAENFVLGANELARAICFSAYNTVADFAKTPLNDTLNPYKIPPSDTTDEIKRWNTADNLKYEDMLDSRVGGITPFSVHAASSYASNVLLIPILMQEFDSVECSYFNIPNIFYADRIKPQSIYLFDGNMTGSAGKVKISLRDKMGRLFRADCATKIADWNDVGNIMYDDGLAVIKSPNLPLFGKNGFELHLSGTRSLHILEINVPCPAGLMNSSSNPSFQKLKSNDYANETADNFVYVTALNLHDDDFNIVGKAVFSQPIKKRTNDGFLTRIKVDF
jgi:hypothetical protein